MKKAELLEGMFLEYAQWQALLAEIGPARMDEKGVAGDWSAKDIVAHLMGWRKRTVARFQALQRGEAEPPPPWPAPLQTDDAVNAWIYETYRNFTVREVLDESDAVFRALVAALDGLTEEALAAVSQLPWMEGQPLTPRSFFEHFHQEHEGDMRAWLARQTRAAETT